MSALPDGQDLKAKALEALRANKADFQPMHPPAASSDYGDLVEMRLAARRVCSELRAKEATLGAWVKELSEQLAKVPIQAVQYGALATMLTDARHQWLESQTQLLVEEGKLRRTEWLVKLLSS